MTHLLTQTSQYFMILCILIYATLCFSVFRKENNKEQRGVFTLQRFLIFFLHFDGFLVLYLQFQDIKYLVLYLMEVILFAGIWIIYHFFYKKASEVLLNNMCMLLAIGEVMLARIKYEQAFKQFIILMVATAVSLLIPYILESGSYFRKLKWIYAGVGIGGLAIVMLIGSRSYGALLSISIAGFSLQPSEFVKMTYVFFIASMLYESTNLRQLIYTSGIAGLHILILVASKDLGTALIFFLAYLIMIYVATRKLIYFLGGLLGCGLAAVVGYRLFSHVQTRVIAWQDPLKYIDDKGYQVCQSLFGIGTGGWFGMGLTQGNPSKIPVVMQDFIFSAISEEFGGIFALCLIMICVSCFFMMMNISMQMKDGFYRLVALGLGVIYATQVFLTLGGVTKFIPSTGVTLPLVSYGGSSLLATMILFGIVQGLYIVQYNETISGNRKGERRSGNQKSNRKKEKAK